MRASGGAASTRHPSITARDHSAPAPVLDDLAENLLPPEPRAGVAPDHLVEKRGRQMRGIRLCGGARHRGARVGEQPLDQPGRARRGGDELARPCAPAAGRTAACRTRRRPGATWQARRTTRRRTAARASSPDPPPRTPARPRRCPFEPPPRRAPQRARVARPGAQQPGRALDHHLAHVVLGLADQRDVRMRRLGVRRQAERQRAHELGAEPRLAGAAPAEREPRGPRPAVVRGGGRLLMRMRERDEVMVTRHRAAAGPASRQRLAVESGLRQKASMRRAKSSTEFIDVGWIVVMVCPACGALPSRRRRSFARVSVRTESVRAVRSASIGRSGSAPRLARIRSTTESSFSTAASSRAMVVGVGRIRERRCGRRKRGRTPSPCKGEGWGGGQLQRRDPHPVCFANRPPPFRGR